MSRLGKPKRGTPIINGRITIKVRTYESIDSVVSRLIKHAIETNRPTRAVFNGVVLNATSSSTARGLIDLYDIIIGRVV